MYHSLKISVLSFLILFSSSLSAQTQLIGATSYSAFAIDQDGNPVWENWFSQSTSEVNSPGTNFVNHPNGKLYATALSGGIIYNSGYTGTIFEFDPLTKVANVVHVFDGINGYYSQGLAVHPNGKLYGTTMYGGVNDLGVVYEYDPSTDIYVKLADFSDATGHFSMANFVLAANGKFYGLNQSGGEFSSGTLVEFDPASGALTKKFDFDRAATGGLPSGVLCELSAGKLYGANVLGGENDMGTLFEFDYINNQFSKLIDFAGTNGRYGVSNLLKTSSTQMVGSTLAGGAFNQGVFYQYDVSTHSLTVLNSLEDTSTGRDLVWPLVKSPNGKVYGMTREGGLYGSGALLEFDLTTPSIQKKRDFIQGIYRGLTLIQIPIPGKKDQTISFNPIPTKYVGDGTFLLDAHASSGLPLEFSFSNKTVCTIDGGWVTIIKPGTTFITACQSGDDNYNAASCADKTGCESIQKRSWKSLFHLPESSSKSIDDRSRRRWSEQTGFSN